LSDQTTEQPRETTRDPGLGEPWRVILYNDEWHTFEEVVAQVRRAANCSMREAWLITHEAHTTGRAVAYRGDKEDCQRVLGVLREIRLQAELDENG